MLQTYKYSGISQSHKTKGFNGLMVLIITVALLLSGCMENGENLQQNAMPPQDDIYIVYGSTGLIDSWAGIKGAIREDGTMILPMEYSHLQLICDSVTKEPRYLQSYEMVLKDGVKATENLKEAYYEQLYTGEGESYFNHVYRIFDTEGHVLEHPENCGIRSVCGDMILYQNNQLVYEPTGEILFDDCVTVNMGEDCYIVSYDQYHRVCVMNQNLDVLFDIEGSDGFIDSEGRYLIITKEQTDCGEKQGLCRIDGTQLVPNEYDCFMSYYSVQAPYVLAVKDTITSVLSLADGKVLYTAADSYEYVQELFDDFMVIQKRGEVENENTVWPTYEYTSQLYDYSGRPMGRTYRSLSPETDLYQRTKEQNSEGVLLFRAEELDGSRCIVDEKGRVVYEIADGEWVNMLTEDTLIVSNQGWTSSELRNLDNNVLNKKEYETINNLYLKAKGANGYYSRSELAVGWYTYNNVQLIDVLDADGNILIERLKSVDMLSEDRFWVEKGFSRGLMDASGNWIYEEAIFHAAADE